MKGRISKLWINELKDGRTYASISVNGDRYNIWNREYWVGLQPGDMVEYESKQSGKYNNIVSIGKVQPMALLDENHNGFDHDLNNGAEKLSRKDRGIVRMSCIKSAIYLSKDFVGMDLDDRAESVIDMAKRFEDYVVDFDVSAPLPEESLSMAEASPPKKRPQSATPS